jgi:hypothetical protein
MLSSKENKQLSHRKPIVYKDFIECWEYLAGWISRRLATRAIAILHLHCGSQNCNQTGFKVQVGTRVNENSH